MADFACRRGDHANLVDGVPSGWPTSGGRNRSEIYVLLCNRPLRRYYVWTGSNNQPEIMAKTTVAIRIEPDDVRRCDAVAEAMANAAGAEMGRGDAARAALLLGLDELEKKFGLTAKGSVKASASKPRK